MNKKTMIAYTILFLFVFTFALSFTLARATQIEEHACCVISYCPEQPSNVAMMGHWVPIEPGVWVCMQNPYYPLDVCDVVFTCDE